MKRQSNMINELTEIKDKKLPTHKSKSLAALPCNRRFAAKHMLFLPTLIITLRITIDKGMIRQKIVTIGLIFITTITFGQSKESYDYTFNEIHKMLKGATPLDFKKAVFLTENAFYSNNLDYNEFCQQIDDIEIQLYQFLGDKNVVNHPMGKQFAIFSYMMEPSKYNENTKRDYQNSLPQ